ncbi:Soyasaponin III rhamnosyltransferase [Handroanthus impetiginosus]|uniref:Soyasaponin III rhamnosyltransferase n=1 Tax=Handroanthus impetiginosus TaxID=429701 RepID=A0A2G9HRL4_9LAMI|nr:Soyasaponin III rhamnosyltransferase [Handroanthus impetiginosus]
MDKNEDIHVVMLPWLAFGHMISFLDLSVALARSRIHVSFISTPRNIQRLPKIPPNLSEFIEFVSFPLPKLDANLLPDNAEATIDILPDQMEYLKATCDLLQEPIKNFIAKKLPNWILVDFFPCWVVDIAQDLKIPIVTYSMTTAITLVFFWSPEFLGEDGQSRDIRSPQDLTVHPTSVNSPSQVAYRNHEAIDMHNVFYAMDASGIPSGARLAKLIQASRGVAIRTCLELEADYSGWGSILEAMQYGHVLVFLPFVIDQPLNARLMVEKSLGIEVERDEHGSFTRNDIANALRKAMVSEEGKKLRARTEEAVDGVFGDRKLHDEYIVKFVEYLKNGIYQ